MPWELKFKEDLNHFKNLTQKHIVIVGRETYYSIPEKSRPLKNRYNIVLNHYNEGDIGQMYGHVLRHYGAEYNGCNEDYTGKGIDQLENVIKELKTDPYSRRIGMTTYNVSNLDKGCLYPCHGIYIQFYVETYENKNYLSCHMTQRSVDCGCGLPFNIVSYSVLTYIIAMKCDMIPKDLIISTGDTHIYNDHLEELKKQIKHKLFPFPKCKINERIKYKDFKEIKVDDFELIRYLYNPQIKLKMSI